MTSPLTVNFIDRVLPVDATTEAEARSTAAPVGPVVTTVTWYKPWTWGNPVASTLNAAGSLVRWGFYLVLALLLLLLYFHFGRKR